jgi:hypothetical protein
VNFIKTGHHIPGAMNMSKVPMHVINFECDHCGRSYDDTDVCTSDDCPDGKSLCQTYLITGQLMKWLNVSTAWVDLYRKLWSYITAETDGNPPLAKVAWEALTHEEKVNGPGSGTRVP